MLFFRFLLVLAVALVANAFSNIKLFPKARANFALNAKIIETLKSAGKYNKLITALDGVNLATVLEGTGPYSIFAPTDAAFEKLPRETVEGLMANMNSLKQYLLFHVCPGKVNINRNGKCFDTLLIGGDKLPKQVTLKVTSWECETFVLASQQNPSRVISNTKCDNGLVFEVDEVLVPYEGNKLPWLGKVTMMGARDLEGTATLQKGYYGIWEGTGAPTGGQNGNDPYEPMDEERLKAFEAAWKDSGNWLPYR